MLLYILIGHPSNVCGRRTLYSLYSETHSMVPLSYAHVHSVVIMFFGLQLQSLGGLRQLAAALTPTK